MPQRKFRACASIGVLAAALLSPTRRRRWPAARLRIAMTASDVPTTTGAPDNGYEGMRFLGFPVFEGLVLWDLSRADKLADIRPGLAESWEQDKNDKTKWIFHLRRGVKFHDGSDFNADAAIWNLDRYYKKDAPQFDPPGAAVAQARNPFVAGYRKIDDYTIEITNPRPLSYFPIHAALHALFEPGAVRQDRLVGRVRQGALRHRPVQDHGVQAAHQRDAEPERGLLGQEQGAEARQDGPVPDAGGDDAARRAALRPGRLDRGAAAGCGAQPQIGRLRDRHRQLSACLAVDASTSASPTRPGATSGSGGRSTTASIAMGWSAC